MESKNQKPTDGLSPKIAGMLYIVATPIGNMKDITYRAVEVLTQVDFIAAEDTRHSAKLLRGYGIETACIALHDHNERQVTPKLLDRICRGECGALICDAGTPLVSDPGYILVSTARKQGVPLVPIPGASAMLAALSVSGLPSDRFVFEGFLAAKPGARRRRLEALATETRTLIFYEAPHRIAETIQDLVSVFGGQRGAVLARELTKRFETIITGSLSELNRQVEADPFQQRGEIVLLIHGSDTLQGGDQLEQARILKLLLESLPVTQAASLAAKITGAKKNKLYQMALTIRQTRDDS